MKNAADIKLREESSLTQTSPETAIISEALELLNEVKRYRGMFYKQQVAALEAKAKKLSIGDLSY